ncbi:MAG: DUF308 domain-containing protein [Blautia sp.]|nr:DUF308 domain-containing protein [Blautia sp.]
MTIVLLMFTGLTMFLIPVSYVPMLGKLLGFTLLVFSILRIMDFFSSNKALIHYINLSIGLLCGLLGIMLFALDSFFLAALNWLVGTLPIVIGGYGLYHALTYARRSGRKGWGMLVLFDCLLLLFGTILFVNPWADDPRKLLYVIGGTLFYSAAVYSVSLFWIWPFRLDDGSDVE